MFFLIFATADRMNLFRFRETADSVLTTLENISASVFICFSPLLLSLVCSDQSHFQQN